MSDELEAAIRAQRQQQEQERENERAWQARKAAGDQAKRKVVDAFIQRMRTHRIGTCTLVFTRDYESSFSFRDRRKDRRRKQRAARAQGWLITADGDKEDNGFWVTVDGIVVHGRGASQAWPGATVYVGGSGEVPTTDPIDASTLTPMLAAALIRYGIA